MNEEIEQWVLWNQLVFHDEASTVFAFRWETWTKMRLEDNQKEYSYFVAPDLTNLSMDPFMDSLDDLLVRHEVRNVRLEPTFIVMDGVVSYLNVGFAPELELVLVSKITKEVRR
jgi:hypothetical protein